MRFALFGLLIFASASAADKTIDTISRIKASIVPIVCTTKGGDGVDLTSIGTGFFVDRAGHVLTAAHVVMGLPDPQGRCIAPAIAVQKGGWRSVKKLEYDWARIECETDTAVDLAICTFDRKYITPAVPLKFSVTERPDGTPLTFTGFPRFGKLRPVTSRGYLAGYAGMDRTGKCLEIAIDKGAQLGFSGSPIYDEAGFVLGLIRVTGNAENTGITVGPCSAPIIDFLSLKGVKAETDEEDHPH